MSTRDRDAQAFETLPLEQLRAVQIHPRQAASVIGTLLSLIALALRVSGLYLNAAFGFAASLLDRTAFILGLALVGGGTATATFHPARRATRIDPAMTLRAGG
jgi:ABC-type lipoprotein release transport system permease subunit